MARTDDDSWDPASGVGATATMVAAGRAMRIVAWRRAVPVAAVSGTVKAGAPQADRPSAVAPPSMPPSS